MEENQFRSDDEAQALHEVDTESDYENTEQRKKAIEMLKAAIPNFTEWGNYVLKKETKTQDALEKLKEFHDDTYVLPENLQDSWQLYNKGIYSQIIFKNFDNNREFSIKYSIVEIDAPNQSFVKHDKRKKVKAVQVSLEWNVDVFLN